MPSPERITAPSIEDLTQQAEYKQHPYGKVWQAFDDGTFAELVGNIDRRGLDKEIIRYQNMILEGWHRYLACLATKVQPKFIDFKGTDLEAAELVHASGVRRHSSADQRYASFDLLCEACPAFKEKYEALKAKGEQQKKEGIPLDTGAQRVDVVGAKAEAAGVSKTTAKKVERVKKENPGAVAAIAAGKTTANKELEKLNTNGKKNGKQPASPKEPPEPKKRPTHNYKYCRHTKVMVAEQSPHSPDSFLVTLKSVEPPTGSTTHDVFIRLDRTLSERLYQQLGEALAEKSDDGAEKARPARTAPPSKKRQPQTTPTKGKLTIRKLKSLYGEHALSVLDGYLDELPRKDGAMRTYKIVKPLPTEEEFKELQQKKYTSTVADLMGSAFGELEILASEVGDWYESWPEGFQSSDKGSMLDDARGTLENLSQPDVPDSVATKEVYYLPLLDASSRAARRDDAVGQLQAVVDVLGPDKDDSEVHELIDELESAISEAESVEFPGMY